jgi:hypothetical protein
VTPRMSPRSVKGTSVRISWESACRRVWKPSASAEPRSSSAARRSTKARGRKWTRTGIVIGEAPNPVMPNMRYAAKTTSGTSSSTS